MNEEVKEFKEMGFEERKTICEQVAEEFLTSDEVDMERFLNHNYNGLKLTPGKVLDFLGYQARGNEEYKQKYYYPLLDKVHPFKNNPELKKDIKEMVINVSIRVARGARRNMCEGCTLIDIEKEFGSIYKYAYLVKELRTEDMVTHREWQNNLEFIKKMTNSEYHDEIYQEELENYNRNQSNKKR